VNVSILDLAARSVEGTSGHKSKSIAAAFVAVALPVVAGLAWLAPDADLGFSILVTAICLPLSAFSVLMYFAHRRYCENAPTAPESASQVRALSASLCVGLALTLIAAAFRVEGMYVLLAALATAIIAASLVAEIRKRGSTRS